jgi:Nucleolar pre-ribosomal-associated protein 1
VLLSKLIQEPSHGYGHHHATTFTQVLQLLDNEVIASLISACLSPATTQKSSLACVLLQNSASAREAFWDTMPILIESKNFIVCLPPLVNFLEAMKGEGNTSGKEERLKNAGTSIFHQVLDWIAREETEEVEEELLEVLRTWGLGRFILLLSIAKPSEKVILDALQSLLPAASSNNHWALTLSGVDKAAAVDALLQYLLSSFAKAVTASVLAPIALTFFVTLSAAFKTKATSSKSSSAQNVELEQRFLQLLDASLSDAVAALSDSERNTSEFAKVAADACNEFGTAVLRKRAEDPVAMRVLRRFAAALLPSGDGGSEDEDSNEDVDILDEISNTKVAVSAAELVQKVVSHSHFLSTMKNAAASPPALPSAAAVVPLPLQSLLPLAETPPGNDVSKEAIEEDLVPNITSTPSFSEPLAQVKRELCMLLESLLDVEDTFKSLKKSSGADLLAVETALLPVVMAAYGGSCSAADKAAWDLAKSLNLRAWKREKSQLQKNGLKRMETDDSCSSDSSDEEGDEEEDVREELCALLEGPLAKRCFAWGPGAVAAAASLTSAAAAAGGDISSHLQALQSKLPLDPVRCALTVTHFPEKCSLFGGGGGSSSSSSGEEVKAVIGSNEAVEHSSSSLPDSLSRLLPTSPAAYDPSFLIPFCVAALRSGLLPPRLFAQTGLASVCLRATAAEDPGLRSMAFEALGLLTQQLQVKEGNQQKKPLLLGDAAAPDAEQHPAAFEQQQPSGDFKERAQLLSLLEWVRDALETPFTRLPAVHAVFLAEAALLISHPSHPMFGPISKARLKTAMLDVSLVPLFRQTILSGSQDARVERSWLLRLLRAGLRSSADARVYLKQYIFELIMGLHDAVFNDSGTSSLALGVILAACSVPRAARELVERGGLVGWLASRAVNATASAISSTSEKIASNKFEDAVSIVNALQTLTTLRAVVGGGKGSARAAEDFAQACRCMLSVLCSVSASDSALTPSQVSGLGKVWVAVLPVVSWTEEAAAGAGVAFLGDREIEVLKEKAERMGVLSRKNF